VLEGTEDTADAEVMTGSSNSSTPKRPASAAGHAAAGDRRSPDHRPVAAFPARRGKVEISVPRDGQPHELVQMAAENASETLHALRTQWQADAHRQDRPWPSSSRPCNCRNRPIGWNATIFRIPRACHRGSMWFYPRRADKKLYRRFNIETAAGARMTSPAWRKCSPGASALAGGP